MHLTKLFRKYHQYGTLINSFNLPYDLTNGGKLPESALEYNQQ